MWVNRIELTDFRNFRHVAIELAKGLNLFLGLNAQGKTNLLESVYAASTGGSYRAARDADMIRWGQPLFRIQLQVQRSLGPVRLELSVSASGRRLARVNGSRRVRPSELSDYLNVVMFTPDHLNLVKGPPSERRRFLDVEISQVSPAYRSWLETYNKALAQRNALLKQMGQGRFSVKTDPSAEGQLLRAWDQQLVGAGARITVRRAQVVLDLSGRARDAHRRIAGDEAELALVYRPSVECPEGGVEEVAEAFRLRLAQLRQAELTRGVTLAGPHRDDFRFELDGVDLGAFGSQGQQRSAVLALKLAEVDFITERVSERPVLLLDDVLSELDAGRRIRLMELVESGCQALLTSVEPGCVGLMPDGARVFAIAHGEVSDNGSSFGGCAPGIHLPAGPHDAAEGLHGDPRVEPGDRAQLEGEVHGDDGEGEGAVRDG
ncbi:MAG: DNA replication/repair protein RecF [Bacillota bacterium]|nr:DNA replication/repair protein RecF [Bacillota bacterium]